MMIAIPLADGRRDMHFGHCERFALVNVDPEAKSIVKRRRLFRLCMNQDGWLPG